MLEGAGGGAELPTTLISDLAQLEAKQWTFKKEQLKNKITQGNTLLFFLSMVPTDIIKFFSRQNHIQNWKHLKVCIQNFSSNVKVHSG